MVCEDCKGVGTITRCEWLTGTIWHNPKVVPCPECKGTGRVEEKQLEAKHKEIGFDYGRK